MGEVGGREKRQQGSLGVCNLPSMGDARIFSVFLLLGLWRKAKVFWWAGPRFRRCPLMCG